MVLPPLFWQEPLQAFDHLSQGAQSAWLAIAEVRRRRLWHLTPDRHCDLQWGEGEESTAVAPEDGWTQAQFSLAEFRQAHWDEKKEPPDDWESQG
jgi:hypothetical protein